MLTIRNISAVLALDLMSVHKVVSIPILRKDFTVDLRDIYDAKVMGASCILLIVAALEKGITKRIHRAL